MCVFARNNRFYSYSFNISIASNLHNPMKNIYNLVPNQYYKIVSNPFTKAGPGLNRSPSSLCLGPDENIGVLGPIIFHKEHVALLAWGLTKL